MEKMVLITGGLGFIGSNFLSYLNSLQPNSFKFLVIDKASLSSSHKSIQNIFKNNPNFIFEKVDIRNELQIKRLFNNNEFSGLINFAAETHVDKSLINSKIFVETNVLGTLNLLNESVKVAKLNKDFRFFQISTDEVYGSLELGETSFKEDNPISPNNPYSASKASADFLIHSFNKSYGLNTIISRSSNNYGPYQLPEKFIPLIISRALKNQTLPIYGNGKNIRDWIYVLDHVRGIWEIYLNGKNGKIYHLGGNNELNNLTVAKMICKHLKLSPKLINFVKDRPGHDFRYSLDFSNTIREINWNPCISFESGLGLTINWYKKNQNWLDLTIIV